MSRHFRRIVFLSILTSFFSLSASAQRIGAPKPNAQPKPAPSIFDKNLIIDSNAEGGAVKAWTSADQLKTLIYGEFGGGPYPDSPGPANRGERYFFSNALSTPHPSSVFTQKIDIASASSLIDEGKVSYALAGWFGGVNTSFSSARIRVTFLDLAGRQLASDETDEVKESDRADDLVLIERKRSGIVPAGAKKAEIRLEFYIRTGHESEEINTNGYADELSFSLSIKK